MREVRIDVELRRVLYQSTDLVGLPLANSFHDFGCGCKGGGGGG